MADKYGVIIADPPWAYGNYTQAAHGAAASAIMSETDSDEEARYTSELDEWEYFPVRLGEIRLGVLRIRELLVVVRGRLRSTRARLRHLKRILWETH